MTDSTVPPTLQDMSDQQFIDYLEMIAADFDQSGQHTTAEDYREAKRRLIAAVEFANSKGASINIHVE